MAGFRKVFSATKRIYHHKKNGVCHIVPKNRIISWKATFLPDNQCSYLKNSVVWLTNCVLFVTNRLAGHCERFKLAQDWLKRNIRLLATFVERDLTRVCLYGERHQTKCVVMLKTSNSPEPQNFNLKQSIFTCKISIWSLNAAF